MIWDANPTAEIVPDSRASHLYERSDACSCLSSFAIREYGSYIHPTTLSYDDILTPTVKKCLHSTDLQELKTTQRLLCTERTDGHSTLGAVNSI